MARASRFYLTVTLQLLGLVACSAPASAIDLSRYQVPLGMPPASSQEAIRTLNSRLDTIIEWNACGREIEFWTNTTSSDIGEGLLGAVIAKIRWMQTHGDLQSCKTTVRLGGRDIPATVTPQSPGSIAAFNKTFSDWYRNPQGDFVCPSVLSVAPVTNDPTSFDFTFTVSKACMKEQINVALTRPAKPSNLGTDGLPCGVGPKTGKGDWDVTVRDLMRVLYLPGDDGGAILRPATRSSVMSNLITVGGPLEEDSYSVYECGNQEHDTGSPQDRADERSWTKEGLFDDLGNLLDWLWHRILIFAGVAAAILASYYVVGLGWVLPAAVAAGTVGLVIGFVRIPESENHLFMINTSRYLTNQLIIDALPDADDREFFQDDQKDIKDWLLSRLHEVVKKDFREYNARPYQRYTLYSLMNLYDFAQDQDLKTASQDVLDFAFAKFAVASSQGRRAAPFRRLMEIIPQDYLDYPLSSDPTIRNEPRSFFRMIDGSDHPTAPMLLFAAQTQQLKDNKITIDAASVMVYGATSTYRPDPVILSIAINKATTYEQRLHHDGFERYFNTPGFLLSAGGIQTGLANQAIIGPVTFDPPKGLEYDKDRGVAVPTTLMAHAGFEQTQFIDLLRIEGNREYYSKVDKKLVGIEAWSFDRNTCMRRGFACGLNITLPSHIEACVSNIAGFPDQWRFVDSTSCPAYAGHRRFYVVIYRQPCTAAATECAFTSNWGFIEAVDDPGVPFEQFMRNVINANPMSLTAKLSDPGERAGTYVTTGGERIGFEVSKDTVKITNVNGDSSKEDIDDWKFAEGDILKSDGNGKIEVHDPTSGHWLDLDFSDKNHPKRNVH